MLGLVDVAVLSWFLPVTVFAIIPLGTLCGWLLCRFIMPGLTRKASRK